MNDTLSLTIPYYQGEHFLTQAIESVLRQRNPNWTLLVSDDSPGEQGVGDLVARYRDSRIRYRKNAATLGLAGNWNACLNESAGDLVTILHADDELLEDYCDVMLRAARDHPDAVCYFCDAVIINERGRRIFSLPDMVKHFIRPSASGPLVLSGPRGIAALLHGDFIMCPTVCYRRDRLRDRRFDERWRFVLDLDFFTRLLAGGEKLVGIPTAAYAYRRHAGSATAQRTWSTSSQLRGRGRGIRPAGGPGPATGLERGCARGAAEADYSAESAVLHPARRAGAAVGGRGEEDGVLAAGAGTAGIADL